VRQCTAEAISGTRDQNPLIFDGSHSSLPALRADPAVKGRRRRAGSRRARLDEDYAITWYGGCAMLLMVTGGRNHTRCAERRDRGYCHRGRTGVVSARPSREGSRPRQAGSRSVRDRGSAWTWLQRSSSATASGHARSHAGAGPRRRVLSGGYSEDELLRARALRVYPWILLIHLDEVSVREP
jgi:hypothetical protein